MLASSTARAATPALPALLALLSLTSGCTRAGGEPADAPLHEIVVTAADFSFRAPDTVPAGPTRIRLMNDGRELHHMQLARIADGHTVAELLDRLTRKEMPTWVTFVGGPSIPPRGGASEVIAALTPGQYAMLCWISTPDRVPHLMKGMVRPLTVVPAAGSARPVPDAEVHMVLRDYTFDISPALRPGRRTIRVTNAAAQPHEVTIVRLAPGKTAAELLRWAAAPKGPPPGDAVGGTVLLTTGAENVVIADFAAGEYALLCFAPDAKDKRPHVAHGMVRQIRVG